MGMLLSSCQGSSLQCWGALVLLPFPYSTPAGCKQLFQANYFGPTLEGGLSSQPLAESCDGYQP